MKKQTQLAIAAAVALPLIFVQDKAEAQSIDKPANAPAGSIGIVDLKTNVNLRTAAYPTSPIDHVLASGTERFVYAQQNDMYQVGENNEWITTQTQYVDFQPFKQDGEESLQGTAYLETNVNLRTAPSMSASVDTVLAKGTSYTVVGKQGDWYHLDNGKWITAKTEYVSFQESGQVASMEAVQGTAYLKTNVNLRTGPSMSASIIRVLKAGTSQTVVGKQGDWYSLGNGQWITANPAYVSFGAPPASNSKADGIINLAKSLIGTPYVFGGSTPSGFDCSGFLYYVYKNNGYNLSRESAAGYWDDWTPVSSPQPGDAVFFKNTYKAGISHAGIYIGNGQMIHAGDNGVAISNLSSSYNQAHFAGYRRP